MARPFKTDEIRRQEALDENKSLVAPMQPYSPFDQFADDGSETSAQPGEVESLFRQFDVAGDVVAPIKEAVDVGASAYSAAGDKAREWVKSKLPIARPMSPPPPGEGIAKDIVRQRLAPSAQAPAMVNAVHRSDPNAPPKHEGEDQLDYLKRTGQLQNMPHRIDPNLPPRQQGESEMDWLVRTGQMQLLSGGGMPGTQPTREKSLVDESRLAPTENYQPEATPEQVDIVRRRLMSKGQYTAPSDLTPEPTASTPAPAPDGGRRSFEAMSNRRRSQDLIANLGHANETLISGIAGNKGEYGLFDNLRTQNADEFSAGMNERAIGLKRRDAAAAAGVAASDATAVWNTIKSVNPALAEKIGESNFMNMTDQNKRAVMTQAGIAGRATETNADRDRAYEFSRERYETGRKDALAKLEAGLGAIQNRWEPQKLIEFGAKVGKYAEIQKTFEHIERLAPGVYGMVPEDFPLSGVDKIKANIGGLIKAPGQFTDTDQALLRTTVKDLTAQLLQMRSGAAATDTEYDRYIDLMNDAWAATPEVQAATIDMVRQRLAAKFQAEVLPYAIDPNLREGYNEYTKYSPTQPYARVWTIGRNVQIPEGTTSGGFQDIINRLRQQYGQPGVPAPMPMPPQGQGIDVSTEVGLPPGALEALESPTPTTVRVPPPAARQAPPPPKPSGGQPQKAPGSVKLKRTKDGITAVVDAEKAKRLLSKGGYEVVQ